MKVLFISHEANNTGAPMALLQLLRNLKESAPDINYELLLKNNGSTISLFEKLCPVFLCDYTESLFYRIGRKLRISKDVYPAYLQKLDLRGFDIVYANSVASLNTGILIKRRYDIPLVLHCHESKYLINMSGVSKDMIQCCDGIIAVSEKCKKNLIDDYGFPEENIIIHYPVSSKLAAPLDKCNCAGSGVTVGFSGINHWIKGIDIVPVLIKRFFNKYPDSNCHFVGIGIDNPVERLKFAFDLREAKLEDKFTMLPHQENPLEIYRSFDIYVLPSREESFSLAVQENACMGNPVVMFCDAAGISECLDESSSIQVPYLDIEAMVDAVHELSSDEHLRKQMGANAKRVVMEQVRSSSNVGEIAEFIRGFMSYDKCLCQ